MPNIYQHLTLDAMNMNQIRHHIETKREKRLVSVIQFHEHRNVKLGKQLNKLDERMNKEFEMLGKELASLDKAMEKVDKRMMNITQFKQEAGLISETMTTFGETEE